MKEIIKKNEIKNLLKSFEKAIIKESVSEKFFKNIEINQ
tara:strand:- start:418 stop:534 length:117 start_codon:yes stop_codon:yes gene_type:complete